MQDLYVEDTIRIATDNTNLKNFIIILFALIGIYILYQTVMLIYHSKKLKKIGQLQKKSKEKHIINDNKSKGIVQSTVVTPKVSDEERQDDIRMLLRGKR